MAKSIEVLRPKYASQFRCIGPDCEDTCCQGWAIRIDKQTYKSYKYCPDLSLRSELVKHVSRNRSNPSEENYAMIKLNEKGICPLLDPEGLCRPQRRMGEEYLSVTCYTFPRLYRKVNGTVEMALTLACPEAARLILLNPERMEFDNLVDTLPRFGQGQTEFNSDEFRFKYKAERYFWPLRVFTISLLQNRTYPVWQRLTILGFFFRELQELDPKSDGIPALIERYTRLINEGLFLDELEAIPALYDFQVNILNQIIQYRLVGNNVTPKFSESFLKVSAALGLGPDAELAKAVAKYQIAFETYYRPFMDEREYILENYLTNYVFMRCFPFGDSRLFDHYVLLIIHYSIIKMFLIGLAGYYKEDLTIEHIVQLISAYSRNIEHHPTFSQEIHKVFKNLELLSMPYMAVLIRN